MNNKFEKKPLISVIIPVYNVANYLIECLDSVIKQDYENLEVILVDDGSTDRSGIICDGFINKDKRIQVFHKKNGGLSDARNFALKRCKGEYITFIDSDDVISRNMISHLYQLIFDSKAQISIIDPYHLYGKANKNIKYKAHTKQKGFNKEEALIEMFYQKSFFASVWGKLYTRELFSKYHIDFPIGSLFEDVAVQYKLFDQCENIIYSNAKYYGYRHHSESITTKIFDKNDCDILLICAEIEKYFEYANKKVKKAVITYHTNACLRIWSNAPRIPEFSNVILECDKKITRSRMKILFDRHARNKIKFALVLFSVSKKLYQFVYPKINRWR